MQYLGGAALCLMQMLQKANITAPPASCKTKIDKDVETLLR